MAAPTLEFSINPNNGNVTVDTYDLIPGTIATDGDLIIYISLDTAAISLNAPAGFTELAGSPFTNGDVERMRVFWKIAAGEVAPYSFSKTAAQRWGGAWLYYRGVNQTTPIADFNFDTNAVAGVTAPNTGLIGVGADNILGFATLDNGVGITNGPAGYTDRVFSGLGGAAGFLYSDKSSGAGGNTGTVEAPLDGSEVSGTALLAIQPPATGGVLGQSAFLVF